jgi:hypothetical protein
MATRAGEPRELIERWKAEHPELSGGAPPKPAARPRLVPPATPAASAPQVSRDQARETIERWRREHPDFGNQAATRAADQARPVSQPAQRVESDRRMIDIANTPLTVMTAFIIGCILGGIAMTIITGIAFWGFSSG